MTAMTASDLALSFRPHVAVLDIGMPKMNGYDLARALRAAPDTTTVRLVALTGWG
jgi:CheY-like chemotaxis protein